jgi:hypothetical protein
MGDKATRGPLGDARLSTVVVEGAQITRGFAVKKGTAENGVVVAGAGEAALGIMQETTDVGKIGPMVYGGTCIAIAGAAVTAGAWLKSDGSGKLIPTAAEDSNVVARAMSDADADGDEVMVEVRPILKKS